MHNAIALKSIDKIRLDWFTIETCENITASWEFELNGNGLVISKKFELAFLPNS